MDKDEEGVGGGGSVQAGVTVVSAATDLKPMSALQEFHVRVQPSGRAHFASPKQAPSKDQVREM